MLETVLVSIGTSLIVSLITFVLGLKSGKNQADRAFLQNTYKKVYSHFHSIKLGIIEGRPKEYRDYKEVSTMYSSSYYPLLKEMENSGDIIYLKSKIAKEALDLEKESLTFAYYANEMVSNVHKCIMSNPQFFHGGVTYEKYQRSDDSARAKTMNTKHCQSYRTYSYLLFLNEKKLKEVLKKWVDDNADYALSFTTRGNPPNNSFTIYPSDLTVNAGVFVDELVGKVKEEYVEYPEILEKQDELVKRLEKMERKLIKKAKNPTGFWETFIGAFVDMFH